MSLPFEQVKLDDRAARRKEYLRVYQIKNHEQLKERRRQKALHDPRHKLRNALFERQGWKCGICGATYAPWYVPNPHRPGPAGHRSWHIDHDHATGEVRGVLCHSCNVALGHLGDDPVRCRAAAVYIEGHRLL